METSDALVAGGFRDAGYTIVWVDDCWQLKERDKSGALVPDPSRWPRGIEFAIQYVHSLGLKFGLYGDIGTATCCGFPGLQGHFEQDAQQMADWGVDAFKVDGCNADTSQMHQTYPQLGRALNATKRPMIYSCSWPDYERSASLSVNFTLLAQTCNSWRIFWDVQAGQYAPTQIQRFDCVNGVLEFYASGSTNASWAFSPTCPGDWTAKNHPAALDHQAMVAAAGPGSFNDADMLPIGANYTMDVGGKVVPIVAFSLPQARSAMALWAALASPLMIGADVRAMDVAYRQIWLNRGLISVNQDALGAQGVRLRGSSTECQVWKRVLSHGRLYVVLFNNGRGSCSPQLPLSSQCATMTVSWQELGLPPLQSWNVAELLSSTDLGSVNSTVSVCVDTGDTAALLFSR
jgi:hypothetical protein